MMIQPFVLPAMLKHIMVYFICCYALSMSVLRHLYASRTSDYSGLKKRSVKT